ncbi:MAG: ATP phosphoribosyltransferase [Rickettsiales bacterium]|nr:ATP phosphoribosyltransferase [Rickettsiales bacterium]
MKKLTFAVPKGRILEELTPLLTKADIIPEADFFNESSRKLVFSTNRKNLDLVKVRSFDVATFVKFGAADLGICGLDVLKEFSSPEIFPVLDLGIGKCRLSIAAKKSVDLDLAKRSHIRIATKYTAIAANYFSEIGIQAEAIKLNGSIEIAPQLKLCDFILDLVSSGKTLLENDMLELQKILDVTSFLTVNRASFKTENSEINQLIKLFDASK